MPQLVRTVNAVIVNALYLTGELGVGEAPDSFMLSSGLDFLNEILDRFNGNGIEIPYLTEIPAEFVQGKNTYSISDMIPADIVQNRIVDLVFANYIIPNNGSNSLNYPLRVVDKNTYNNIIRQNDLQSRPSYLFLNNQPEESLITVYPTPDQPYQFTLQAKIMLNYVTNQDTIVNLTPFYYGFLKYALARKYLSIYPSANWPQTSEDEYQMYLDLLENANETDITIKPSELLSSPTPPYPTNIFSYNP